MSEKRDFKGVWIPKEIWLNKEMSVMEKLFLVEIDSLDNKEGCYASNAHFSEMFDLTKGRCTQIIKSLESKLMVNIELIRDGKLITKRTIRVVNKLNRVVNKLGGGSENIKLGYIENAQGSNTKDINTLNGRTQPKGSKGGRLTLEKIPTEWAEWSAVNTRHVEPIGTFDEFHDYWVSVAGAKGSKLDWFATWRNWCRREQEKYENQINLKKRWK